jgi:sulfite exporter TauE/SafE
MNIASITPLTSFVLGLLASVSTCLVVVGGLVFTLSATLARDDAKNRRVFYLFHAGRLGGFAVLGGVLGLLGGVLAINATVTSALTLLVGLVMLVLGLNLVGLLQGKALKLPRSLFAFFMRIEHSILAPLALGVGTFFFPCGFTQSAQVAALASGSFFAGAALMFAFALGTLPMLLALSFGVSGLADRKHARRFYKIAGSIVILMALVTLWSGLSAFGIVRPLMLWPATVEQSTVLAELRDGIQYATLDAHNGYTPQVVLFKADIPARLTVRTQNTYDCSAALVIPAVSYKQFLASTGEQTVDLGTHRAGEEIQGGCAMGMYSFVIRFIDQ